MRAVLLVVALVLLVSAGADAQDESGWMTGNELKAFCQDGPAFERGVCSGFAVAVADFTIRAPVDTYRACIPVTQVTRGQLRDIMVKYLDDHPEKLHHDAIDLTAQAFGIAFPCPK